ncbi:MAG: phage holin family protein [Deltaproteobacteria bacterium]|nr:phage holin family protein [Deltaproteobacteria bacterium]
MQAFLRIALNGVALLAAAHLVPGIHYQPEGIIYILLAGLVIGLINLVVKPIAVFFSFPLIIITLGFFYLIINGLMLQLAAALLPELSVAGCLPAILGGIVMGLFNWGVQLLFGKEKSRKEAA